MKKFNPNLIKKIRKSQGKLQTDFNKYICIKETSRNFGLLENGKTKRVYVSRLEQIAEWLQCEVQDFFEEKKD